MDTKRKVTQLDRDVHEIYNLVETIVGSVQKLDTNVYELRAMVRRQGNRVDNLEANVAQLAEDVTALRTDMAVVSSEVTGLDAKLDQVLALLAAPGQGSPGTMPE